MISRLLDYLGSVIVGLTVGFVIGVFVDDRWGGGIIGATVGVFIGAGVRAWRTRDVPESYEDRGLND